MTGWGPSAVVVTLIVLTIGAMWILPRSHRRRCIRCDVGVRRIFVACPVCGRQLIGRPPRPRSRLRGQARDGHAGSAG
jgi:predicted RNA-binding Zn-ribbon protein involved in translation (DUF1610 family)